MSVGPLYGVGLGLAVGAVVGVALGDADGVGDALGASDAVAVATQYTHGVGVALGPPALSVGRICRTNPVKSQPPRVAARIRFARTIRFFFMVCQPFTNLGNLSIICKKKHFVNPVRSLPAHI